MEEEVTYYEELEAEGHRQVSENPRKYLHWFIGFFHDMFDNCEGINLPYATERSTFFDWDRWVQLLEEANDMACVYVSLPNSESYTIDSYPYSKVVMRYLLTCAMMVCTITHLMRCYVEMPDTSRVGAPDVVRRDYLTRWQTLLNEYKDRLKNAAKQATMDQFDDRYAGGANLDVLVDYPSAMKLYVPWSSAGRPFTLSPWW